MRDSSSRGEADRCRCRNRSLGRAGRPGRIGVRTGPGPERPTAGRPGGARPRVRRGHRVLGLAGQAHHGPVDPHHRRGPGGARRRRVHPRRRGAPRWPRSATARGGSVLPDVVVLREGSAGPGRPCTSTHEHAGRGVGRARGRRRAAARAGPTAGSTRGSSTGALVGEATFVLPGDLPLGWHTLRARHRGWRTAARPLVVTPRRLELPPALAERRAWGFMTQLYSVRSRPVLGARRPRRPGRARRLERPRARRRLRPGQPAARGRAGARRWSPRRTCRPPAGSSTRSTCGSRTSPRSAYLPATERAVVEWQAEAVRAPQHRRRPARPRRRLGGQVGGAARPSSRSPAAAARQARVRGVLRRARARAWSTSPPGARWPSATACRQPTGRRTPRDPRRPAGRRRCARSWPTGSSSTCGCSGASTSSWPRRSRRPATPGMPIGIVHDLAVGVHPDGADAWALRDVARPRRHRRRAAGRVQPAWARTGPSRRGGRTGWPSWATRRTATCCARSCATPAGSASTTSSGCSGCGGCPRGCRPTRAPTSATTTRR